ncbi:MAG: hypothetical protein JSW12_13875 [Deltaproteobacteria bacterium]|nr:MAG: hypothetical protein JSW12_13875 [Deltaproteobacteria bacterium]
MGDTRQKPLFAAEAIFQLSSLDKYEIPFSFLDTPPLIRPYPSTRRPPIPYEALLGTFIYKGLRASPSLSDLVRELRDNPPLALKLGFHPLRLPCVEGFSVLLQDTENSIFQEVRGSLTTTVIDPKEITGTSLSFDSCNVPATLCM